MRPGISWIVLIALVGAQTCFSQPLSSQPSSDRPKIALVLEGGGALGFAHIGVIEWLEQHHIPVDFVAGTSMGGMVGGMYAAGNSPDQIRSIVRGIDWPLVLDGSVPFSDLSFRRKEDRLAQPNRLAFGLLHGLSLPSGLNSGHEVGMVIDRVFLPYYNLRNFDELPIPFRCVATDLVSGKEKVFGDGPIQQALRATIAIPTIFEPIRIGDKLYADGSAVNNLPVDVAKSMGADIVIAVYLQPGPYDPKALRSLLGVGARTYSILMSKNEEQSKRLADVLVPVDISDFSAASFERGDDISKMGVMAAERMSAQLGSLRLDDTAWAVYVAQRDSRRKTIVPVPQSVTVDAGSAAMQTSITYDLRMLPGHPINPAEIRQKLSGIRGSGVFSSLGYSLAEGTRGASLVVQPRAKEYGPPFLNLGITLIGSDPNEIRLGINGRLTFFDVAGYGSEWRTELAVGPNAGGFTELFRPISVHRKWFVAPHAYFRRSLFDQYSANGTLVAQFKERRDGLGADVGYLLGSKTQLRIGQDFLRYGSERRIGQALSSSDFSIRTGVASASFQYFGQNDALVPTRGTLLGITVQRFSESPLQNGGYQQAELHASTFLPVSPQGSFYASTAGGTSFGKRDLGLAGFRLGGPFHLSAYGRNELLGDQYFIFRVGYLHRLFDLPSVLGSVYGMTFFEAAKVYRPSVSSSSIPQSGSLAVIMKSLVGPVYAGGSFGDNGHRNWWFGIGRIF
ncbi:MAG: patatin-like phospholipase family protein [Bryobacteraceae bacterium]